jgi:hypothetical protein
MHLTLQQQQQLGQPWPACQSLAQAVQVGLLLLLLQQQRRG